MKRSALSFIILLTSLAAAYGQSDINSKKIGSKNICQKAIIGVSTCYMRQQPDYESALETQELMGTVVEIIGEKGYWREIQSPQPYKAWVTEKTLVEITEEEAEEYEKADKVIYTGLYGHVFKESSFDSKTICDLVGGDVMRLSKEQKRLRGRWTEVILPSGETGYVPTEKIRLHEGFCYVRQGESLSDKRNYTEDEYENLVESIIRQAKKLQGVPYLWGGMSSKGVDCSGLVRISYLMNGIALPRNASQQINCGKRLEMEVNPEYHLNPQKGEVFFDEFKQEMHRRLQNLKRGDLVFFGTLSSDPAGKPRITHVGIYLGENRIIHSSHLVRINSLIPGDKDYYENSHRLLGAVRL